ncbi:Nn.00g072060.m01.CDS01 [Neocucurbitaria sp. VM-36]
MSFQSSFSGSSRGGFAPRKGRGGWGHPSAKPREPVKPDIEKHPLGCLLHTIHTSDLLGVPNGSVHDAVITDCQYIASYSWLNDSNPTIVVPGKPAQWTPLQYPQKLKEDSGQYFRDPNAARYPCFPMAPVVHAVLGTDPDICPASVDLFACGSTLGNLLRFVRGMDRAFRFNVEVIGKTTFLVRKENDPKELIKDVRGFGHSFPEAYTTWEKDVKGTETHQRIVQYALENLKCLVRFECDGYINDASTSTHASLTKASRNNTSSSTSDDQDLLQSLQGTTISQPCHATTSSTEALTVKNGGSVVSQRCIFDLKTRSSRVKGGIDMDDIYPLLWLKQIPNFVAAYHDGYGLFNDIRVQDVRKEVQKWEQRNTDAIHRLSILLKRIIKIAKQDARGLLEVYFSGAGGLEIRSQHGEGTHALPTELMDRWADNKATHDGSDFDTEEDADQKFYDFESDDGWKADSDDEDPDYTACSADDCGYCGKCMY